MKLSYDPRYNIAYIAIKEKTEDVETLHISDDLHIDIGPDGKLYGIELLNANEQLQKPSGELLTIVNEAVGTTQEVPLTW